MGDNNSYSNAPENEYPDMSNGFDELQSITSYNTVNTERKKNRDEFKEKDKGFYSIKRIVGGKTVKIEMYSTNSIPGLKIRDPITGVRYENYNVGKNDEHLFFKVRMTTVKTGNSNNKNEITLFYENPQQYEKHMFCTLSPSIKNAWFIKYNNELSKRNKN